MYDIIIIGAGPAGLTAAIYARRANKKTLVLEAKIYGGQMIETLDIENYPAEPGISGVELANKFYKQAKNAGAEFSFEKVNEIINEGGIKLVRTDENEYKTKTVIVATGSDHRKLGLVNEADFIGRGISYCATCDGALFSGKTVAVAGGGNGALYEALYLSGVVSKVYLIHRRNEFRGEEDLVRELKEKGNVEFILGANISGLIGHEKLEKIEVATETEIKTLEVAGLFVAIGREPSNKTFAGLLKLDDAGYVEANEDCKTNVEGIFAAGDNRVKSTRQIVTATADGAIAASAAIKYINGGYYATH